MSQPHVRTGTYEQSSQVNTSTNQWAILTGDLVKQWAILTKRAREPMSNRTGKHKINEQASQIGTCMGCPLLKFAHTCIYLPPKKQLLSFDLPQLTHTLSNLLIFFGSWSSWTTKLASTVPVHNIRSLLSLIRRWSSCGRRSGRRRGELPT